MVNPIALYVPPALPVLQTSSTALVSYRPPANSGPVAIQDAADIQVVPITGTGHLPPAGAAWPTSVEGPENSVTRTRAASAYAAASQMGTNPPSRGRRLDTSV